MSDVITRTHMWNTSCASTSLWHVWKCCVCSSVSSVIRITHRLAFRSIGIFTIQTNHWWTYCHQCWFLAVGHERMCLVGTHIFSALPSEGFHPFSTMKLGADGLFCYEHRPFFAIMSSTPPPADPARFMEALQMFQRQLVESGNLDIEICVDPLAQECGVLDFPTLYGIHLFWVGLSR